VFDRVFCASATATTAEAAEDRPAFIQQSPLSAPLSANETAPSTIAGDRAVSRAGNVDHAAHVAIPIGELTAQVGDFTTEVGDLAEPRCLSTKQEASNSMFGLEHAKIDDMAAELSMVNRVLARLEANLTAAERLLDLDDQREAAARAASVRSHDIDEVNDQVAAGRQLARVERGEVGLRSPALEDQSALATTLVGAGPGADSAADLDAVSMDHASTQERRVGAVGAAQQHVDAAIQPLAPIHEPRAPASPSISYASAVATVNSMMQYLFRNPPALSAAAAGRLKRTVQPAVSAADSAAAATDDASSAADAVAASGAFAPSPALAVSAECSTSGGGSGSVPAPTAAPASISAGAGSDGLARMWQNVLRLFHCPDGFEVPEQFRARSRDAAFLERTAVHFESVRLAAEQLSLNPAAAERR
jgi:hypothetical protein